MIIAQPSNIHAHLFSNYKYFMLRNVAFLEMNDTHPHYNPPPPSMPIRISTQTTIKQRQRLQYTHITSQPHSARLISVAKWSSPAFRPRWCSPPGKSAKVWLSAALWFLIMFGWLRSTTAFAIKSSSKPRQ